jgi:hypothetical protein
LPFGSAIALGHPRSIEDLGVAGSGETRAQGSISRPTRSSRSPRALARGRPDPMSRSSPLQWHEVWRPRDEAIAPTTSADDELRLDGQQAAGHAELAWEAPVSCRSRRRSRRLAALTAREIAADVSTRTMNRGAAR